MQSSTLLPVPLVVISVVAVLFSGCAANSSAGKSPDGASQAHSLIRNPTRLHISAAFGADGKLWRVVPGETRMFVDYSDDFGESYSTPIAVNRADQKIRSQEEDRPRIAVGSNGLVAVSYSADADQPWTTFVSVSRDAGRSFPEPMPLSSSAKAAKAYQAVLGVSPKGEIRAFWHDERDARANRPGNAIYSASLGSSKVVEAKVASELCECCRIAVDFDAAGLPILAARFIYPGQIRDHGLLVPDQPSLDKWRSWRVTQDDWQVEACPEHGPSLSIAADGVYHLAWFTQGQQRKGIFYAHSHDGGRNFGDPKSFGSPARLAGHPDVVAVGANVHMVWREFDGEVSYVMHSRSNDGGHSFGEPRAVAESRSETDVPQLLKYQDQVYLAWNSIKEGFQLIPLSENQ